MACVVVDYGSGNLHSVEKSFRRMADTTAGSDILLTSCADEISSGDRIVLPGVGAFAACRESLLSRGLFEAIEHAVLQRGVPFLGICVGMQLLATVGLEHGRTPGFDWIPGQVERIRPEVANLKIPHMGWNELCNGLHHPLFGGIEPSTCFYFVHSYRFVPRNPSAVIARTDYAGPVVAAVADGNVAGVQFHPEKSQAAGLKVIGNFLGWRP